MLGFGLGLRAPHYKTILDTLPPVDWFEIISENFLIPGGKPFYFLDQIRMHYPIVMHGVSLSIGSCDPLNWQYLKQLKQLIERVQPVWVSDHLCWTGIQHFNMHDLLPLVYTEEMIKHVVERVKQVQDFLGRELVLENVSSYVTFTESTLTEWAFLSAIAEEANCKILLDINNVYVSAFNHGFDPLTFLEGIPMHKIKQFHLAGHTHQDDYIIDTHDASITHSVWTLYTAALKRFGHIPTSIERDDNIPPLEELLMELEKAKTISNTIASHVPCLSP